MMQAPCAGQHSATSPNIVGVKATYLTGGLVGGVVKSDVIESKWRCRCCHGLLLGVLPAAKRHHENHQCCAELRLRAALKPQRSEKAGHRHRALYTRTIAMGNKRVGTTRSSCVMSEEGSVLWLEHARWRLCGVWCVMCSRLPVTGTSRVLLCKDRHGWYHIIVDTVLYF